MKSEESHYEQQRRHSLEEEPQPEPQSSVDSAPHRGLIRLPANSQIIPIQSDWSSDLPPLDNSFHPSTQPPINPAPKPTNSTKPCVVIRPTQHVTAVVPQYTPSSSPDTNSNVDNYQQISPYLRTNNYSEYAIPHFMNPSSFENNEIPRKKLKPNIEKSLTEALAAENDLPLCRNDPPEVRSGPIPNTTALRTHHIE